MCLLISHGTCSRVVESDAAAAASTLLSVKKYAAEDLRVDAIRAAKRRTFFLIQSIFI
jgi:hypothetical protein